MRKNEVIKRRGKQPSGSDAGDRGATKLQMISEEEDQPQNNQVAAAPSPENEVLNRYQTEEWKGWMQFTFLLYHYMHAMEIYNSIRSEFRI